MSARNYFRGITNRAVPPPMRLGQPGSAAIVALRIPQLGGKKAEPEEVQSLSRDWSEKLEKHKRKYAARLHRMSAPVPLLSELVFMLEDLVRHTPLVGTLVKFMNANLFGRTPRVIQRTPVWGDDEKKNEWFEKKLGHWAATVLGACNRDLFIYGYTTLTWEPDPEWGCKISHVDQRMVDTVFVQNALGRYEAKTTLRDKHGSETLQKQFNRGAKHFPVNKMFHIKHPRSLPGPLDDEDDDDEERAEVETHSKSKDEKELMTYAKRTVPKGFVFPAPVTMTFVCQSEPSFCTITGMPRSTLIDCLSTILYQQQMVETNAEAFVRRLENVMFLAQKSDEKKGQVPNGPDLLVDSMGPDCSVQSREQSPQVTGPEAKAFQRDLAIAQAEARAFNDYGVDLKQVMSSLKDSKRKPVTGKGLPAGFQLVPLPPETVIDKPNPGPEPYPIQDIYQQFEDKLSARFGVPNDLYSSQTPNKKHKLMSGNSDLMAEKMFQDVQADSSRQLGEILNESCKAAFGPHIMAYTQGGKKLPKAATSNQSLLGGGAEESKQHKTETRASSSSKEPEQELDKNYIPDNCVVGENDPADPDSEGRREASAFFACYVDFEMIPVRTVDRQPLMEARDRGLIDHEPFISYYAPLLGVPKEAMASKQLEIPQGSEFYNEPKEDKAGGSSSKKKKKKTSASASSLAASLLRKDDTEDDDDDECLPLLEPPSPKHKRAKREASSVLPDLPPLKKHRTR